MPLDPILSAALTFFQLPLQIQTPSPLDGVWLQPCQDRALRLEVISGERAALTEANYLDNICHHPKIALTSEGRLTLPSPQAAQGNIDFYFDSVTLTLLETGLVKLFNEKAICGFPQWELNQPHEITGGECDLFQTGKAVHIPKKDDARFGIYSLPPEENGQILLFGRLTPQQNGSTPERRPSELDPRAYRRQTVRTPGLDSSEADSI